MTKMSLSMKIKAAFLYISCICGPIGFMSIICSLIEVDISDTAPMLITLILTIINFVFFLGLRFKEEFEEEMNEKIQKLTRQHETTVLELMKSLHAVYTTKSEEKKSP